ncbi:hypothetical protein K438DRAFT_1726020 [Mycena galopus ATCC 62051]|nr:hypothetical protein K438DRAFT_1726020 [Mycena galopus ATCC 62051]
MAAHTMRKWAEDEIRAVDQRNKWKYKFGLALHSCTDLFVGAMHWMKIWWTNSNPRLILSYHLDRVDELEGTHFVIQGQRTKYGLTNGHMLLRHLHDPT